tara:strand:- start:3487 stop:4098 length:612 start_codon:yes stop_codon:yes gene_type:complete
MNKRLTNNLKRERQVIAQESARIMIGHGIRDYSHAKQKAADRLNMSSNGSLPSNKEIELAISEQLQIFDSKNHEKLLRKMRKTALSIMQIFKAYSPRLVGPVLKGTADKNSAINFHIFTDSPESIAFEITDMNIKFKSYERRLKTCHGNFAMYAGFEFNFNNEIIQITIFPFDGIRQSPNSPINGKPMKRADINVVINLLANV